MAATRERRLSAVGLVLGAACSVQGGAAVAKTLFPELGPPGVVFLRLLFGSLALWAIARLPLGIAVTVEFLGPLAVAVLLSRRPVDLVWVALAGSGVA
ncbi:MAG TPA: hypothetical protein VF327_08165, partial [Gaiellaceae bacterium]